MTNNNTALQICQINISGLSPRSHTALNQYNCKMKNDILATQETLINPSTMTSIPSFSNMETYYLHNDRGVSLSINTALYPQRITTLEDDNADAIWATLTFNSKTILIIGNIYTNPNASSSNNLSASLSNISNANTFCSQYRIRDMIILGDFNSRHIKWGDSVSNNRGKLLDDYITDNNLICTCSTKWTNFHMS